MAGAGAGENGGCVAKDVEPSPSCVRFPARRRSTHSLSFIPPQNPSGKIISVTSARTHRIRGMPNHTGDDVAGVCPGSAGAERRGTGFSCDIGSRRTAQVDIRRVQLEPGRGNGEGRRHVDFHCLVGAAVNTDHVSSRICCTLANVSRTMACQIRCALATQGAIQR